MKTVLLFRKAVMFFKIKTVRAQAGEVGLSVPLHRHGDLSLSSGTRVKQLSNGGLPWYSQNQGGRQASPEAC